MTKGDLCNGHCTRSTVRRNKKYMRHYYEYTLRLFNDGRPDDYLNELFLSAAKNGDYERVQNFLARTSRNTSVNVDAKDKNGFTAIMHAAVNEHSKVVSLLLSYGADITLSNDRCQTVLDFAPDSMRPLLLGSVARQGYSSRHLLQAAWQGNLELVKKLLTSKSKSGILDVNCKNADGLTPLLLVTRDINLFEKIEKAVLEDGYHPAEVVRELLQHKADCGAEDSEGKRPLHFAAHGKGSHARDVLDALIEKAASNIDVPDRFSNSPLHFATKQDNQPILLALIRGGANVNARGHIGKTPLHIAASHGYVEASGTLLKHGADVTITDDNGQSPVDVAKGRRVQIVLKDAWAEQTKHYVHKKILSAPCNRPIEQESAVTNTSMTKPNASEDSSISRIRTTMQGSEKILKKRQSQSSLDEESSSDKRTSTAPTKTTSETGMPRILTTAKASLTSDLRNTFNLTSQERYGQKHFGVKDTKAVVFPSLTVLNIELRDVRNLRDGKQEPQVKRSPSHLNLPSQYRLHHRFSSPVLTYHRKISPPLTPDKDARLRSSSTSQVPSNKTALPSRVPPLAVNRVITPELRSVPTPEVLQDRIPLASTVVDLDLLRQKGLPSEMLSPLSPVFLSEVREDTPSPSPPSPRGESRCSDTNQKEEKADTVQEQSIDKTDMTATFTSKSHSTFWIPADDDTETDEKSKDTNRTELSSNGTSFYIDLKNLEALASGSCSLCKKPLPEGNPAGKRGSAESSPEKALCKSCQPRRRSNEGVFWIPFNDKKNIVSMLQSQSKVESEPDKTETIEREKSRDKILEQDKLQKVNIQGEDRPSCVIADAESGNKTVILANDASALTSLSPFPVASFPSNMTGFDVSCVCDNKTGLCSCTISRKDLSPSSPTTVNDTSLSKSPKSIDNSVGTSCCSKTVGVVKTVGEPSSRTEHTLIARPDISYDASAITDSASRAPRATKDTGLILNSFSDTGGCNFSAQENEGVRVNAYNGESGECSEKENFPGCEPHQSALFSPAPQPSNKSCDGLTSHLSPPKRAWSTPTPRTEETGSGGIRIVNPFPSPEPPEDKSAVHPPIGSVGDLKSGNKKGTAGKKGKKGGTKSAGNGKSTKARTKAKDKEQNGKCPRKKKTKEKKNLGMKMITVQQREAGEDLELRTISQGGLEMPEDVPVPPTLTGDSLSAIRAFNTRILKGKMPILSPIPESPRSKASTPREAYDSETVEDYVKIQDSNVSGNTKLEDTQGGVDNSAGVMIEGGLDVVDGRLFDKLKALGSCLPGFSRKDSDTRSDTESNEALDEYPQRDSVGDPPRANTVDIVDECGCPRNVQDEADDAMEELVQRELSLREKGVSLSGQKETGHASSSMQTREQSLEHVQDSRDFTPKSMELDIESDHGSLDSRPSSEMSSHYSDTDSSYNSCGSDSPRPFSSASSLNSSDTYISSPRDSSRAVTPTPGRDTCSENSVEMDYYERMAREKSAVSSSGSEGSSTLAHSLLSSGSLGNISQGPMGSFSSVTSDNLVRSRLSASSRSPCSTSCEEEIAWRKGNLLGKGAFGTVWCGLTNKGELIAVKQVELNHSNWDEAEEQYEKLQEEVYLLKSLKHPNIVKFIGTCLEGGVVNIFMEFVPGGSIASILARFGCLDEPVFRRYTKQLLSGVSYLHGNNVIHRDIKGGNILIMSSGVLKLIDFGCAKRLYMNLSMSRSNILRSMKGTPYWMAPEVIRETGHGRKSDIWSVGCTVFEMATGKPPWSDMPPMAAIFAIGSGTLAVPKLSEDFSESARDFVNKCLTRDPGMRPSADELLQHNFIGDLQ
ncbi:uncharacterized protein [Montipora capricornis]